MGRNSKRTKKRIRHWSSSETSTTSTCLEDQHAHKHRNTGSKTRKYRRRSRRHRSSSRRTRTRTPSVHQRSTASVEQQTPMLESLPAISALPQPHTSSTPLLQPPLSNIVYAQNTAPILGEISDVSRVVISGNSVNCGANSNDVPMGIFNGQQKPQTEGQSSMLPPNVLLNLKDISQLLQTIVKPNIPSTFNSNMTIIPEFDPALKNNRIDQWILKVDECAKIYSWDEAHIIHYALPKLVGSAKVWYQGQASILHTWAEWQTLLKKAFPTETNYGVLLTEMLQKRLKHGENLDSYFMEKLMLLNACDIFGKKAVDCIILGIDDRTIRAGASSARFSQPEDLLKYLKDVCTENVDMFKTRGAYMFNKVNGLGQTPTPGTKGAENNFFCFNCKEKGHRVLECTKPIIKCTICKLYGHTDEKCTFKKKDNNEKQVLEIDKCKL